MTIPRDDATVPWSHAAHAKDSALLAARAATLRALHHAPEPLVLPSAWDAASARIVVEAGFPAVATTSSGVAACLGWADGEQTPPVEMFAAIARIARVVTVPVTADLEGGYGLGAAEFVARLLATGAVGCNIEDTDRSGQSLLRDPETQANYLAAVKRAGRAAGVEIVVNARIDVFVRQFGNPAGASLSGSRGGLHLPDLCPGRSGHRGVGRGHSRAGEYLRAARWAIAYPAGGTRGGTDQLRRPVAPGCLRGASALCAGDPHRCGHVKCVARRTTMIPTARR